jgi:type VI secretion system protein ImpB
VRRSEQLMPKESIQKKIARVRPPRVHITYDVETNGAIEKKELPFVVGVLSDLSGQPEKPLPPVKDRKFVEIDRDNFDAVMARMTPHLAFRVDNKLTNDDTQLGVELKFSCLEDFEPQNIAEQVEPLRKLLELRRKLSNLRSSLYGNDKLDRLLQQIVQDKDSLNQIRTDMGLPAPGELEG